MGPRPDRNSRRLFPSRTPAETGSFATGLPVNRLFYPWPVVMAQHSALPGAFLFALTPFRAILIHQLVLKEHHLVDPVIPDNLLAQQDSGEPLRAERQDIAAGRRELAQLIGRLLARHWLAQQRQTDLRPHNANNSSTPCLTSKPDRNPTSPPSSES